VAQAETRPIDKELFPQVMNDNITGEARDLPVGSSVTFKGTVVDFFEFQPRSLVLTVDAIEAALASPSGIGGVPPGYMSIEYKNPAELGGRYTLYLQVERTQ
jgi:hypothetical protein